MIKTGLYLGTEEAPVAVPLFTPGWEKTAFSSVLLPDVAKYIESLKPRANARYVLVNALGASEWWGPNTNADAFDEASLVHAPDGWSGNTLLDSIKSKDWPYGFPTFYNAGVFAHHRNGDRGKAFGDVELAAWNPHMKRVELVLCIYEDKCRTYGGEGVWDKLGLGLYPSLSMGCRVIFDSCAICLDKDRYQKAWATFDPKKHKYPGEAILEVHKKTPIRGVSVTRASYCSCMKKHMNKILPDGRKVFVYNDFPRFFDISFVFIGADKTAKAMMKIADGGRVYSFGGAELAERLGYTEGTEKTASSEEIFKEAFLGKKAKVKRGEIVKGVPSTFVRRAVPALSEREADLPAGVLDALSQRPLGDVLSSTAGLGIVLKPAEFQRIMIRGHARRLEHLPGCPFGSFSPVLANLLLPFLESRSSFGPIIERRVIIILREKPNTYPPVAASLSTNALRKMSSAYTSYRDGLMNKVAEASQMITESGLTDRDLMALAHLPEDALFTSLSAGYLKHAFLEAGESRSGYPRPVESQVVL